MKRIALVAASIILVLPFFARATEIVDVTVLEQVKPAYPRKALIDCEGGTVSLAFVVNTDGRAENIRVVDSTPMDFGVAQPDPNRTRFDNCNRTRTTKPRASEAFIFESVQSARLRILILSLVDRDLFEELHLQWLRGYERSVLFPAASRHGKYHGHRRLPFHCAAIALCRFESPLRQRVPRP